MVHKNTSLPIPEPVPTNVVCSACGEQWSLHGENPTLLDCIRVLKMYRQPRPVPYYPWYTNPIITYTTGINTTLTTTKGPSINIHDNYLSGNTSTFTPKPIVKEED